MAKVDLKKDLKHLYNPSAREVSVVDVPPMNFLMVDGIGDPNVSPEYQQAMEVLFSLSYALKFRVKKSIGIDYAVMPLEGLWWTDEPTRFSMSNKAIWKWTAMIMQPEYVTAEMVAEALDEVREKKGLPALERVRFENYHEGLSAQIMHIGPYAAEEPTIARLHSFIRENGYEPNGKHHEIYLSDPRRTAAEKLKTVLRQPIRK
ncbi:MAG: GyrI-like domain-containing protein [Thermoflexales bacterium]|nr:GyrI-like domain-containing protein [Thermoflexales bacterium]